MKARRITAVLLLALSSGLACNPGNDDDGIDPDDINPAETEAYLSRNFAKIPRITEALNRILLTMNGNPQPGVVFTPITGGVTGSVGVDLDNNGVQETTVNATVILNNPSIGIAGGARLTITALNAESATGSAGVDVALQSSTVIVFSEGSGTLFPTEGPSVIDITDANLTVTLGATPLIIGSADFFAGNSSGTAIFESNGSGGFQIRVTSPDFDSFIVP